MQRLKSRYRKVSLLLCVLCFSLQRILGIASLDEVLDQRYVNPQNIIHNMTKVNKHGVVTLDDKTSRFIYQQKTFKGALGNFFTGL